MADSDIELAGIGEHQPCPKRGVLVFASLPPAVQNAEDSRQEADYRNRHWRASVVTERPATATERALLTHLGYAVPTVVHTRVQWLSDGVRRRTWPQIPATLEGLS
ncbi:hypothetical protein [Mycolicibacterium alvei]|uniref:hypothetical protein n=1 Tax=Mycolicibacterium alvei TaxID=67081 RepID=UPI0021F29C06|nr:hypothetical protein [Mycolicibacterium alvei]MCV7000708.1 hypothetical protein [Mycolicibacterium alvei]